MKEKEIQDRIDFITSIPFFGTWSNNRVKTLLNMIKCVRTTRNQVILKEG